MGQPNVSHKDFETRAREGQEVLDHIKQRASDAAETVADEGAKALRAAGQTAEDAVTATKRFVQSQPLLAVGAVAAFACAVGALWALSGRRRNQGIVDRVSDYVEPHYRALRRRI